MADAESAERRRASNREAAKVSRMRKKARLDELQRTVVFLTRENADLREQNEIFRRILAKHADSSVMDILEHLRNENQALKVALYDTVQTLSITTGALERGLPHAATALDAAEAERLAEAAAGGAEDDDDDDDEDGAMERVGDTGGHAASSSSSSSSAV